LPSIAVGQKTKKAKEKARSDSLYKMTMQMMDRFNLDSSGYHGLFTVDTLFYDNKKIKSIGSFAIDRNTKKSDFKIGKWTEYYENGQLKSIGEYQMSYVLACRSAMPGLSYYSYKINNWTYYYVSGQVMANGKYELEKQKVFTGIANQFAKKSVVTNDWLFYNSNGQITSDNQKIIADLDKME
jgi:antitoxin component YwqK of YwqJK toxin-antitoxin module